MIDVEFVKFWLWTISETAYQYICVLKIILPVGADLGLTSNVPNIQLEARWLNTLNIKALVNNGIMVNALFYTDELKHDLEIRWLENAETYQCEESGVCMFVLVWGRCGWCLPLPAVSAEWSCRSCPSQAGASAPPAPETASACGVWTAGPPAGSGCILEGVDFNAMAGFKGDNGKPLSAFSLSCYMGLSTDRHMPARRQGLAEETWRVQEV